MRVDYFRCYWPSNLVFVVRYVTYVTYLSISRKIGQKLRSLSRTIGISDQWRSQGAVAAVASLALDSDKNMVVSVHHYHIFISTRSVLWPRI